MSNQGYSQNLQIKINTYIDRFIQIVSNAQSGNSSKSNKSIMSKQLIKQIITSSDIQDWLIIRSLIQSPLIQQNPKLQTQVLQLIQSLLYEQQQSYIMHIYLYGLLYQRNNKNSSNKYNKRFTNYDSRTQRLLKTFAIEGKLSMFNSWLIEMVKQQKTKNNKQTMYTLSMLLQYYPMMLGQQRLIIQLPQLQFMLYILTHVGIQSQKQPKYQQLQQQQNLQQKQQNRIEIQKQFNNIYKLLKYIKTYRINIINKNQQQHNNNINIIDNEEHQIISITLDILAQNSIKSKIITNKFMCSCSLLIFAQQSMLIKQSDMRSFVAIHGDIVLKYSQQQLTNIFTKLFSHGIQTNTLALLRQLSYTLKQAQRFYQLKILYQRIILPFIIYRAKTTLNLQNKILQLASFYIIGFYQHCNIGLNGLKCLLINVGKLKIFDHSQQKVKQKWIELALLLAEKNIQQYRHIVYQSLIIQGLNKDQINKIDQFKGFDHFQQFQIWQITLRNSKKYKIYQKNISKLYQGIDNNNSQCYIISVMQALFTTQELPRILKQFYSAKWTTLSYHMKQLFKSLKSSDSHNKGRVTVDHVKKYSPQQFAFEDKQEDAQQYLSKVLQRVEQQLTANKQNILLEQFYKSFRFKITRKLQCQHCSYVIDKSQELFIHTVPNRTSLRENHVEEIQGYKCQKCTQTKFLSKTTFLPTSKILIIHINRFSFTNGKSCKQLATQQIKRNFLNYKLKGIIFHIGKIVECGHYVYYFNYGGKKWIEMNDHQADQFQLENQDQQFQREMKSQMTPYILFYTRM